MNEKVNLIKTEYKSADKLLRDAKREERRKSEGLTRVNTLNGYVMTSDPAKWEEYNRVNNFIND